MTTAIANYSTSPIKAGEMEVAVETAADNLAGQKAPNPALRTGFSVGALLISVMTASLVAANRHSVLDPYAFVRNAASYGLFALFSLIPVIRFFRRPAQMFAAGLLGWALFVAGYEIAGLYFYNLFNALRSPLEVLIEGVLVYGIVAVALWNMDMILRAKSHPIAPRRHSARKKRR